MGVQNMIKINGYTRVHRDVVVRKSIDVRYVLASRNADYGLMRYRHLPDEKHITFIFKLNYTRTWLFYP